MSKSVKKPSKVEDKKVSVNTGKPSIVELDWQEKGSGINMRPKDE